MEVNVKKTVYFYVLLICYQFEIFAVQFYSQFYQDQYVYENFFQDKTEGVFIDIGAHDGIAFSNTKFFEEQGWTGICIEPIPEVFDRLKTNRSAICIQGCIADSRGTGLFLKCEGYTEMLSGLYKNYHPEHLERIKNEQKIYGGTTELIEVQLYKLNDLLKEHHMFHVDYLTIDTEGNELDILKSIDFDRFDIDVIDVENNYNDKTLSNFLISKGYKEITKLGCDTIFKKKYKN